MGADRRQVALQTASKVASRFFQMRQAKGRGGRGGGYLLPVGFLLQSCIIALILLWAIQNPDRGLGRILNSRLAVHVGMISFSLYLWQQIFLTSHNKTFSGMFPFNLLCTFAVAECSYWLVERTFLVWRKGFVPDA
jgi:peptidoglycan/LPS O-acetylase OafA/YrhL